MSAYYNENDPKAAAWLRELIRADVIVRGDVDERDIREVRPSDLVGITQCHFFAGIGGWSYALRLAGWPDTEPVWSGSCPCQPFSAAGKGGGTDDERHLWPAFYQLIAHARPAVVFGEQVASPAGLQWLAAVQTDLEVSDYAVGVADLPAASVGAPHIRQRLFWLAESGKRRQHNQQGDLGIETSPREWRNQSFDGLDIDRLAESVGQRCQRIQLHLQPGTTRFHHSEVGRRRATRLSVGDAGSAGLSQRVGDGCVQREALEPLPRQATVSASHLVDLGIPAGGGRERLGAEPTHSESVQTGASDVDLADADRLIGAQGRSQPRGRVPVGTIPRERDSSREHTAERVEPAGDVGGSPFWSDCDWIPCRDGKSRPVEPGTFPLAHGISGRVGLLRGYGNAIVPQVAAEFISAYLDIE